ncbi:hypothetical protein MPNT_100068 [Candidatus Methylacidithermus pantelleriae]|uniref:Uncharacterized protein n=1 Tax=Candidatus Methylacidithermus pantelleriae TaxID=2744239 RepID=A0A8J2FRJ3_9BACT|nr:hypothetical protein MPNT_100068 [Candidatus Methylacidithermus pantelleriae]
MAQTNASRDILGAFAFFSGEGAGPLVSLCQETMGLGSLRHDSCLLPLPGKRGRWL